MERQKIELLFLLNKKNEWTTGAYLSRMLKISRRSVTTYIQQINCEYPNAIESSNKGYRLLDKKLLSALNIDCIVPNCYDDRKKYIIHKTLLTNDILSIDSLADFLCISPVTLLNELSQLRRELKAHNLTLKTKNGEIFINGDKQAKKNYIIQLLSHELEEAHFDIDKLQTLFFHINLEEIRKIVLDVLSNYNYYLDDFSLMNYIIYIAVAISGKQIKSYRTTNIEEQRTSYILNGISPHILNIVNDIFDSLNHAYGIIFSYEEKIDASILMMTKVISKNFNKISMEQIPNIVGKEIADLLSEIIMSVSCYYHINLKQDDFMIRFALHLKNLFIRLKNHVSINNTEFGIIKNQYPFMYAVAVYIATIIREKTGYVLSENEISYIALHVGVLIQEQKTSSKKLSCVVYAPQYNFMNNTVFNRIKSKFYDTLQILDIISTIDELSGLQDIDIIFSINDLNYKYSDRTVVISPFFTKEDEAIIGTTIQKIQQTKRKQFIENKIKYLFREDLFFVHHNFQTSSDVIEYVCDDLLSKDLVDNTYKEEIYTRENIAPSSYGNFAIPHPLTNTNKVSSSFIALVIQKNPIKWGANLVNFVFMLSVTSEDRYLIKLIFDYISEIIFEKQITDKLLSCRKHSDFMRIFLSNL